MRLNLKYPGHRQVTYLGLANFTARQYDEAIATTNHKYAFDLREKRSDFR